MTKTIGVRILALASLLLSSTAFAQARPPLTITITPTRVESAAEDTGASVTVISAQQIEQRQYETIADALQDVPGLNIVQSGGAGKQTAVFMRGTNSNHVLVLIDGVRASDPSTVSGTFNFAHLPVDGVERVEVVRGPLSTLYGSDAIGGVINIITRKGKGPTQSSVLAEAGSFRTFHESATVSGSQSRFNYNVTVTALNTDGASVTPGRLRRGRDNEADPYANQSVSSRLGADLTESFSLSLFTRYIGTTNAYDGSAEDPDTREKTHQWYNRLQGDLSLFEGAWKQTFGASYVDVSRRDTNDPDGYSTARSLGVNHGERIKYDWQNDLRFFPGHTLTVGAETEEERFSSRNLRASSLTATPTTSADRADARTTGIFANDTYALTDRLTLSAGGRIEDHSRFDTFGTYRAGAAYVFPSTETRFKVGYGTGFKAPTLSQLFAQTATFSGNPNLQPEESKGWEAGLEQGLASGRVTVGSTFFHNDITNLIVSNATFTSYANIGRARTWGFESFIQVAATPSLSVRLDHTYTEAEDRSNSSELLRRPKHKIGVGADYNPTTEWTIGTNAVYNGSRADIDAVTFRRIYPNGATTANLTTSYKVSETWTVFGRASNLFNRKFEDPDGFQQPGLGVFGGVRARF